MSRLPSPLAYVIVAVGFVSIASCAPHGAGSRANLIVGTWIVKDSGAPFPFHMYVFNADGTMQQANPDAGDPTTSDSDGKGAWEAEGERIKGRWVEIVADRASHQFAGRVEITFELKAGADTFAGTASGRAFDVNGSPRGAPSAPAPLEGMRVTAR